MKPPRPASGKKATKASVHYGPGKNERCGVCIHYGNRICTLVAGEIDPKMWCELFE